MNNRIKGIVVVLLLIATSFVLCNCKNTKNYSDIADYNEIVIQIEANDINSFQEKITDAKNENLLNENSLYLMTILDEQSWELDGFIIKRITYTETGLIKERNYPINILSISWVKENSTGNLEDIRLDLTYCPDYDKSYVTSLYSLSSVENIYEFHNNVSLYLYLINDYTWCRLRIINSCIDFKDVVEMFNRVYDTIDIK